MKFTKQTVMCTASSFLIYIGKDMKKYGEKKENEFLKYLDFHFQDLAQSFGKFEKSIRHLDNERDEFIIINFLSYCIENYMHSQFKFPISIIQEVNEVKNVIFSDGVDPEFSLTDITDDNIYRIFDSRDHELCEECGCYECECEEGCSCEGYCEEGCECDYDERKELHVAEGTSAHEAIMNMKNTESQFEEFKKEFKEFKSQVYDDKIKPKAKEKLNSAKDAGLSALTKGVNFLNKKFK